MFKERKFALLSLFSALVVVSTAFAGVSIYAQTDDSELTTFEEEALNGGAELGETGLEDDNATSSVADNVTDDGGTQIADVSSIFEGLQVCSLGTAEISNETQTAAAPDTGLTPTVSVEIMSETEVAELSANETETAAADNQSAQCVLVGEGETSTGNTTAESTDNGTSTLGTNETAVASAPGPDGEIMVIEGQDFAPGQVVLIFSENALLGIDDVDTDGSIEAKIPVPEGGETAIAGNETGSSAGELRFVETGTQRTATFEFDGETLTASAGGDIEVADGEDGSSDAGTATPVPAPAPSGNATNSTNSNFTAQ